MAISYPRFGCGIVVTGTCTINFLCAAASTTITIQEGTYWNDPAVRANIGAGTVDALGYMVNVLDAADGGATYTCSAGTTVPDTIGAVDTFLASITRSAGTFSIRPTNAGTNAAGKRFLRFLGFNTLADTTAAISTTAPAMAAAWSPNRAETGSIDDMPVGYGVTGRTVNGYSYAYDLGSPLMNRIVSIRMPGTSARRRNTSIGSPSVIPIDFESLVWPWVSRGNPIRYVADKTTSTLSYLTTAMTATSTTCVLNAAINTFNDTMICIDGEWCDVVAGAGTNTMTLIRDQPVAHPLWSPVSTLFVGTYVLGASGGNINMRGYNPQRVAVNQDRWDMDISLDRTLWT